MKGIFSSLVAFLSVFATFAAVVSAIFYFGAWSQSYDSKLNQMETKLSLVTQDLAKLNTELVTTKELALTAKIRTEGVKSQTAVLGKELKVDIETPFQRVIADAENDLTSFSERQKIAIDVGRPPLEVTLENFLFESKGCDRRGADVVCKVVATNLLEEDRVVQFGRGSGTLYDNNDDAMISRTAYFHGQQYSVSVPAKSRSNTVYTFKAVAKKSVPVRIGFLRDENGKFNDVLRTWLTN